MKPDTNSTDDLAVHAAVNLKKGEGRTLKAGGLWVFDNEIASVTGSFANGDILAVQDFDGYFMGYGFINTNSKIRVRMLTRRKGELVTAALLKQRVRNAWEYRKKVIDTSSCRLIFGDADFLPGLTVDKYEDILVVESLALGIDRLKDLILCSLVEILAEDGIRIRGIFERSDAKVREKEGLERIKGFLSAPFDTNVGIIENGVRYIVDVMNGQKTGFFLDQKLNRLAIQPICKGADVLDCFTHTGSFGLNAALGGASHVISVDASELAIEQARKNAELNNLQDRIDYQCADVFELLPDLERQGRSFDVVILDPPAFTKSRASIKAAVRGYREINIRGMRLVKDGGYLATCSCSHFMDADLFAKTIAEAARDAHVRLRQVEFRTQAADHPILWADSDSYYLKFYIFQVVKEI
uniref:class I SAM-dependent rRNA methyltransferase n=1 Tax=Eubacterium cellulosolvens TaxID=29322 RepID=UPI0006875BDA|nr:class I SAM-dependent rRNA methyltransferase [[Eubacterium] cellulosolvens]